MSAAGNVGVSQFKTTTGKTLMQHVQKLIFAIENFTDNGIQAIILEHSKHVQDDLVNEAPYDYEERWDTYHMAEHMEMYDYKGEHGVGISVVSGAPYSGHLEYGTATHGVQHIFFRPVVYKNRKLFKEDVIRILMRTYNKIV